MKKISAAPLLSPTLIFPETVHQLLRYLKETPLLSGWLLLGLVFPLVLDGWTGFALALANLVLTGFYVLLIRWMTPAPPQPFVIKRPRLELAAALALFGVFLLTQLLHFGVWEAQPWQRWLNDFFSSIHLMASSAPGIPGWAAARVSLAISSAIKTLLPTLLAFTVLGYGGKAMGFTRPHWKLSAVLVGLTAAFGLFTGVLTRAPIGQVLALYAIGILVNALPEELFFRGFLLPRLERVLRNPLNALVISALLFNALHIPISIYNGATPFAAFFGIFSLREPTGLIWGYLYLRTRSIIPGVLWHAANANLGFFLLSFG